MEKLGNNLSHGMESQIGSPSGRCPSRIAYHADPTSADYLRRLRIAVSQFSSASISALSVRPKSY